MSDARTIRYDYAPLTGYRFHITCPRCGGSLHHVADGRSSGFATRAVAYCPKDRESWLLELTLRGERTAGQAETMAHRRDRMART